MILFTNEGNPLGLKILSAALFAKKEINVKIVNLDGERKLKKLQKKLFGYFDISF
jgi:Glutathione S-transferase, N-terminal domain